MKRTTMAMLSLFFAPTVALAAGRGVRAEDLIRERRANKQRNTHLANKIRNSDHAVYTDERQDHVNTLEEYLNKFREVERAQGDQRLFIAQELSQIMQDYEKLASSVEKGAHKGRGISQMILELVRGNLGTMQQINRTPSAFTVSLIYAKVEGGHDRNYPGFPSLKGENK